MPDLEEEAGAVGDDRSEQAGAKRRCYVLEETGFDEVPKKYRKFYRKWKGPEDELAPNEAFCPVCKIVVRSTRELRPGDRIYCMACMTRLIVVRGDGGLLEAHTIY
jgi:hypothetical protein